MNKRNIQLEDIDVDTGWMTTSWQFWELCKDAEFSGPIIDHLQDRVKQLNREKEDRLIQLKANAAPVMDLRNENSKVVRLRIVNRHLERQLTHTKQPPAEHHRKVRFWIIWAPVFVVVLLFNLWVWW